MNKTVTVNISGYIFNIEEEAYQALVRYLGSIKGTFRGTEGADEIVADIESRIAELFQERLNDRKQVITVQDVDDIIGIMGAPEDYTDEEPATEQSEGAATGNSQRKIFRDPDNHVLGGVCSGISHYFGIDPLWIRLAFVLTTLAWGGGILAYLILWVIIPEASNTAERLQMKGEDVTVENIRKSVNETAEKIKSKVSGIADDLGPNGSGTNSFKNFFEELFSKLGSVITVIGKVLVKIIGVFLIIGAIFLSIAFIGGLVATDTLVFSSIDLSWTDLSELFFMGRSHLMLCITSLSLLFLVPVVGLFYLGIRMVGAVKSSVKGFSISLFVLFAIGIILAAIAGVQFGQEFRHDHENSERIVLPSDRDTVRLNVLNDPYFHNQISGPRTDFIEMVKVDEENGVFGQPIELFIRKSASDRIEVEVYKSSSGPTQQKAIDRIENIVYEWGVQDSTGIVNLSPFFKAPREDRYRGQKIDLVVRIPEGKFVSFGPNIERIYARSGRSGKTYQMVDNQLELLN